VTGFRIGDRVAVGAITPCFQCEDCLRGAPSQCGRMLGGRRLAHADDGTLAEFFRVDHAAANLAPIPDGLADEDAVYCTETLSAGFMAAENAAIPLGGTVAVFGQGPLGLMATAGARLLGAGLVIAVDTAFRRKELAVHYGADAVLDFRVQPVDESIRQLTGGRGVDSAIEAAGSAEAFEACVKVTRAGGTISNVGQHGRGDAVPIPRLDWGVGLGGKTIRTGLCPGGAERMQRLMRLISGGRIDPSLLTTHRFRFDELPEAFRLMTTREDGILKALIRFA
jgi:threonine dehydrogenase-like Zn-dependent dehydrogenase